MTSKIFLSVCLALSMAPAAKAAITPADIITAIRNDQFSRAEQLAESTGNALLIRYAHWAAIVDDHAGEVSFDAAHTLIPHVREWPLFNRVRMKAEQAALREAPDSSRMQHFCKTYPPISGRGMIACARAGAGSSKQQAAWLKQGWEQGDFTKDEEAEILSHYGAALTAEDHRARIDRLLFEGKTSAASRMLWRLNGDERRLADARVALRTNARDANAKLARVPAALHTSPGLLFERILWRHQRGMSDGVIALFLQSPAKPAHPDVWWPLRVNYARKALRMNQTQSAMRILEHHGKVKREFLAEALWMKGWIHSEYRNDSQSAYKEFYKLYRVVQYPVSKARAAYWAAMVAKRNGNADITKNWLQRAARYPTVFYGQLALAQLKPNEPLQLPDSPSFSGNEKAAFDKEDSVRLITLLARNGGNDTADTFILSMAEATKDPSRLAMLASLARALGQHYDAVRVAKIAMRHNIVLLDMGWPRLTLPPNVNIEPALTLAITRQESEFNPQAISPAGARGYMQLLPGTAQETARKIGVPYSMPRLFEQAFNLQVGSAYLGRMIDAYGGSYIAGIASYNAGPGNTRKWYSEFGNPGGTVENSIRWMEAIPFAETRNYVQRVLENLQIYRARLGQKMGAPLIVDLKR